jgi:hypothetical protein
MDKIKLMLVAAFVVVVLLVVIKALNFNLSEISAGPVKLKMAPGIVPPPEKATSEAATTNADQKVRELEEKLNSFNRTPPAPSAPKASPAVLTPVNIEGYWQAPPYSVLVKQMGSLVNIGFYYPNGLLASVCQGSSAGYTLQVTCNNGFSWANYAGTLSAEARKIDFVTYARGFADQFSIVR